MILRFNRCAKECLLCKSKVFLFKTPTKIIFCDVTQSETRVPRPAAFRRKAFDTTHFSNHAKIKLSTYMLKQKCFWPNLNKLCQSVANKQHTQTPIKVLLLIKLLN